MKKIFKLEDLDCANCAAKMEAAIAKVDGVESVSVNFFTQKLTLEAADDAFDDVLKKVYYLLPKLALLVLSLLIPQMIELLILE